MTEAELMNAIIEAARLLSWKCAHFRAARTSSGWRTPLQADAKGWPDLVLVRDRIVFAEVKVGRGRLSSEQEAWFGWLEAAGAERYLWRETDWVEGRIDEVLRRSASGNANPPEGTTTRVWQVGVTSRPASPHHCTGHVTPTDSPGGARGA